MAAPAVALLIVAWGFPLTAHGSTECEINKLAYEYARTLRPDLGSFLTVFDALRLESECGVPRPQPTPVPPAPDFPVEASTEVFVVGEGYFGTAKEALQAARKSTSARRAILFREGVHFLSEPISLGPSDSGLILQNFPNESAWLSGGVPLSTNWQPYNVTGGANVYVTDIDPAVAEIPGLMTLDPHQRLTRARYPNANPEQRSTVRNVGQSGGLLGYFQPRVVPKAEQVWVNASAQGYNHSTMWQYNGYGNGRCAAAKSPGCPCGTWQDKRGGWTQGGGWDAVGDESYSYHCSDKASGGWEEMDTGNGFYHGPALPLGLWYNTTDGLIGERAKRWSNATGGVVVAWRAQGWFVNMYEVTSHDPDKGELHWSNPDGTPRGGWQGGRGWQVNRTGGGIWPVPPIYVENIFEELDAPGEWFFDETSHKLYLWHNGTGAPDPDVTFVATNLRELVGVRGTRDAPATNITIRGLGFRDARETFSTPWGVPSGGDWALHRGGAIFVEGASFVNISANAFTRVDANGILLSGWTRYVTIELNSFQYIGDSAMAAWGYTEEHDGTGQEQPRYTTVEGNVAHEVGIYQLQSAMWFQAKTALTTIRGNVFFNGPRSGINLNDGFGGGTNISHNLIFNQCRHSGDHGPINTWDRQPFLTDVRTGKPSWQPAPTSIFRNFIIANYGGSQGVDNDDGSSWYSIHHNYFYGEGLKMDYGGHDSEYYSNVNVVHRYDGQNCINVWGFRPGYEHRFYNNTCAMLFKDHYGDLQGCRPDNLDASVCANVMGDKGAQCVPTMLHNSYYTPNGTALMLCANKQIPLSELQKHGIEQGSTEASLPSDDEIVEWGRQILGL